MPSSSAQPYIQVKSVWKVFGEDPHRALDPRYADRGRDFFLNEFGNVIGLQNVSFDVARGETFVVMGLSGSGKSTLVRCIIRLIEPTAGEIHIDGDDITGMSDRDLIHFRRNKIAMVFQHYGLMPHRNVLDNAAWGLEIQGVKPQERYARTHRVLELVGLVGWEQAYPRQLSGGMQQRVGLARALAVDTDILLMDEPFSGLDPLIRRQMQDELLHLQTELRKTIIFITHDLREALKLAPKPEDRIVIMRNGRVVQIGSSADIVLRPENEYVVDFTQDVRPTRILTVRQIMVAPRITLLDHQDPRAVLPSFTKEDEGLAWLVDRAQHYRGLLTVANARVILGQGIPRFDQAGDFIDREHPTVSPDISLDELIPIVMARDFPLPVVDDHHILIGEVHRRTLASVLADTARVAANA